jgi:hypothetical protein
MDLSLIGPYRREATRVGDAARARLWLTVADMVGLVVGAAVAVALILALIV